MQVIGIGDNVVDKYINLNKMFPGGNALNFSVYAKKLEMESAYMGVFGDDKAANHINKVLSDFNIDTSHCRYYEGENAYAEVSIEKGERNFVGTNKGGISSKYPLEFTKDDLKYISDFNLIHTSCYSQIENELSKLSKLNIPISFDFSENYNKKYIKKVCLNINYAFFSCADLSKDESIKILKRAVENGCELAIATRGEKGALLLYNNTIYQHDSKNIFPKDTLGAGDAFITAFLLELVKANFIYSEEILKEGLESGVKFAADSCKVLGAFGRGKQINN